jgi:chromosome segregation ATPase
VTRPWDAARIAEVRAWAAQGGPDASAGGLYLVDARRVVPEALDEIERLRADVVRCHADLNNRAADLDAMRTELIEAKRERNAALDAARELEEEVDELNQRIGSLT